MSHFIILYNIVFHYSLTTRNYFEWSKRGFREAKSEVRFFERSEKKRSSMSEFFFDS